MNHKPKAKIKVTQDGPYLVSGGPPLEKERIETDEEGVSTTWRKIQQYPHKPSYSLCRCGKSNNKPYCDGHHATSGFKSQDISTDKEFLDNAERFEGKKLVLFDNYDLCASARFCDRAGGIWELINKEDSTSQKIAREECANCPSGRLVLQEKDAEKIIEPVLPPSISVTEDPAAGVSGPLWVKGKIKVESPSGGTYEIRNRVTLCRCGKSKNMPFCDSSHIKAKFSDQS